MLKSFDWIFGSFVSLFFFSVSVMAAVPPEGYIQMSALEKRAFHQLNLELSAYEGKLSGILATGCSQALAFPGNFLRQKLAKTLVEPSGYADAVNDRFRARFGKSIHARGPMATGEWELLEPILGLASGSHPVTIRFSLANIFIPYFPGARFRPGFLIIIHRDGLEDMNLFIMPPNGLDGFRAEVNPFDLHYTHWLDKPGIAVRVVAAATFGRVVVDPLTQIVTDEPLRNYLVGELNVPTRQTSKQITLSPSSSWAAEYQAMGRGDYRTRFSHLKSPFTSPKLFSAWVFDGGTGITVHVGSIRLTSPFVNAEHSDVWMAQHQGFVLWP